MDSTTIKPPSLAVVNGSLMLVQILFGFGGVITALGLPASNPFAFALYREIVAGGLLLAGSFWVSSRKTSSASSSLSSPSPKQPLLPQPQHYRRFVWLGLAIWGNQAANICGIKLAGAVAAAVWQPSQPIITAAISMALRWEPLNWKRVAGMLVAFASCALMVVINTAKISKERDAEQHFMDYPGSPMRPPSKRTEKMTFIAGNALFFLNCLATSLYVLMSKQVLQMYSSLTVTAWSYNIAAIFMAVTAVLSSASQPLMAVLCPDCSSTWGIPAGAYWALAYSIVFNSIAAYAILTWANQYATGTLVMGYTVLQPVTAALFTMVLLGMAILPDCRDTIRNPIKTSKDAVERCLVAPGFGSLCGIVGICMGLYLIIVTEPKGDAANSNNNKQGYDQVSTNNNDNDDGEQRRNDDGIMMAGGGRVCGLQERSSVAKK